MLKDNLCTCSAVVWRHQQLTTADSCGKRYWKSRKTNSCKNFFPKCNNLFVVCSCVTFKGATLPIITCYTVIKTMRNTWYISFCFDWTAAYEIMWPKCMFLMKYSQISLSHSHTMQINVTAVLENNNINKFLRIFFCACCVLLLNCK